MESEQPSLRDHIYDRGHPLKSPLLGRFISSTLCAFGHQVVVMELDQWDEPWIACRICGARFLPESAMAEDYDVVQI